MITEAAWSYGIEALAARYARDVPPVLSAIYLEQLNHLTDTQWAVSVKRVIRTSPHFPTIDELLQATLPAKSNVLSGALLFDAVKQCTYTGPNGETFRSLQDVATKHGPAAADAFAAIGGPARLHNLDAKDEAFARREFAQYFAQASEYHDTNAVFGLLLASGDHA